MVCLAAKPVAICRLRQPRHSPLYKTIERYLPEFERTYDKRYAKHYGPWRPVIVDTASAELGELTLVLDGDFLDESLQAEPSPPGELQLVLDPEFL